MLRELKRWAIAKRGRDLKRSVAGQKVDTLRLRREEGKMTREWERRDDRITEPDHENTKLRVSLQEVVEAQVRQARSMQELLKQSDDRGRLPLFFCPHMRRESVFRPG